MSLSLLDIKRLAVGIAGEENPALHVVAALNGEGTATYAEVVLTRDDVASSQQLVIGVTRQASESEVSGLLRDRLRERLRKSD